ncbi:hypothetical protein [Lysinibacillus fusiformis]|uniref:hypothetical protein n=1 Tax=Lysinibacillus fusiformis TaxID=28031 RepID=UPI003D028B9B
MSKSLNAMLSAMLLFSVVAPTASAETLESSNPRPINVNLILLLYQNITINIMILFHRSYFHAQYHIISLLKNSENAFTFSLFLLNI